jgi:hypothetical protein
LSIPHRLGTVAIHNTPPLGCITLSVF